jgi:hypothetical protein
MANTLSDCLYHYRVDYTKRFVVGDFPLTFCEASLRFADWHSADSFVRDTKTSRTFGLAGYGPPYTIEDAIVVAI